MIQCIESYQRLLKLLESIEHSGKLTNDQMNALLVDKESIHTVITIVTEARSKQQIREAWTMINEIKKNFGGYAGDETGRLLTFSFEQFWQDISNLL